MGGGSVGYRAEVPGSTLRYSYSWHELRGISVLVLRFAALDERRRKSQTLSTIRP